MTLIPEHTAIYLRTFPPGWQSVDIKDGVARIRSQQAVYVSPNPGRMPCFTFPSGHTAFRGKFALRRVEYIDEMKVDYLCCAVDNLAEAKMRCDWCVAFCTKQFKGDFDSYRSMIEKTNHE